MVRKELDKRIRTLIESGVKQGHRSFFVVVGDKAQDQVILFDLTGYRSEIEEKVMTTFLSGCHFAQYIVQDDHQS